MGVRSSTTDSGAVRSVGVLILKSADGFRCIMAQRPGSKRAAGGPGQAPADHGRLNGAAGLVIAPFAIDPAAGERKLISTAVVLAKHLNRFIRRWLAVAVEFGQTSFARCHFQNSPLRETRNRRVCVSRLEQRPCLSLGLDPKSHRANEVSVWYLSGRAPALCNLM